MKRNPKVDDYIARQADFARPILEHVRDLVHATVPEAAEAIKWGMPHFTYKSKNVAGMAAFKAHASFGIHGESRTPEAIGQAGKLKSLKDLPKDKDIAKGLLAAVARIESRGTAMMPRDKTRAAKPEIPIPEDLSKALSKNAAEYLANLAPSHRREYLEWIVGAKRPETRARRIAQAAQWLGEGKRRNWKYENC